MAIRIAYVINQYPKVSHSFIRREILALERQGIEIMRIALRGWSGELVDAEDRLERERTRYVLREGLRAVLPAVTLTVLTRPMALGRALLRAWQMSRGAERPLLVHVAYLAEACVVARWLRAAETQHVHAHFGTNSAEVAMLAQMLGGPQWSFTVHGPEEFDQAPIIGLATKLRSCAFVVAISSYGRSQIYRLLDQSMWPSVHVVHCGLEKAFHSVASGPPSQARRLVCVGRLCEQKGQLLLVEAARRLAAHGMEFELVLAGDGDMRGEIAALIERYRLQTKVRITGWISSEQVRAEILNSRALVLPSFAEGLPIVIMEAMALRRPVISTYVAGIPELVHSGVHGWLVPGGDVDALAAAMRACLAADPKTLAQMGANAHARVLERHDADREADKLVKLFKGIIDPEADDTRLCRLSHSHAIAAA